MGIIYATTMYSLTLPQAETDKEHIKTAIIKSDRSTWNQIDRVEFKSQCNARFSFEGRRYLARKDLITDGTVDVTFYTLTEEQIGMTGQPVRIDVIDIAVPK